MALPSVQSYNAKWIFVLTAEAGDVPGVLIGSLDNSTSVLLDLLLMLLMSLLNLLVMVQVCSLDLLMMVQVR